MANLQESFNFLLNCEIQEKFGRNLWGVGAGAILRIFQLILYKMERLSWAYCVSFYYIFSPLMAFSKNLRILTLREKFVMKFYSFFDYCPFLMIIRWDS